MMIYALGQGAVGAFRQFREERNGEDVSAMLEIKGQVKRNSANHRIGARAGRSTYSRTRCGSFSHPRVNFWKLP